VPSRKNAEVFRLYINTSRETAISSTLTCFCVSMSQYFLYTLHDKVKNGRRNVDPPSARPGVGWQPQHKANELTSYPNKINALPLICSFDVTESGFIQIC
jgi:hypothetical protein